MTEPKKYNQFESLLKDNLEQFEAPYNPDGWRELDQQLNQAGKTARLKKWLGLGASGLVVGGAITLATLNDNSQEEIITQKENTELSLETTKGISKLESREGENANEFTPIKTEGEKTLFVASKKKPEPEYTLVEGIEEFRKGEPIEGQPGTEETARAEGQSSGPGAMGVPLAFINISQMEVCVNEILSLDYQGSLVQPHWDFGDGTSGEGKPVQHVYNMAGYYMIYLYDLEDTIFEPSDSIGLMVHDKPNSDFVVSVGKNLEIELENDLFSNDEVFWDFGDGSRLFQNVNQHNYAESGTYSIKHGVTSVHGCESVTTKAIFVEEKFDFYSQNAFTPNGDNTNDYFIPASLENSNQEFIMSIFNRRGEKIFETTDSNNPWDGRSLDNKTREGVYIWLVRIKTKDGWKEFNGTVSIIL